MIETTLAEAKIEVGHHETAHWPLLGTVNIDTITATAIAAVIVIALAFFLRAKVTSTGVPGGVQLFFEAITIQMRQQIETAIGMKIAPFVLPLAVTIFTFILISNWLSVLPVQFGGADGGAGGECDLQRGGDGYSGAELPVAAQRGEYRGRDGEQLYPE